MRRASAHKKNQAGQVSRVSFFVTKIHEGKRSPTVSKDVKMKSPPESNVRFFLAVCDFASDGKYDSVECTDSFVTRAQFSS